jgi:general secretion pathway protein E
MPASADSLCEGKFNFFYQNSNSDIRVSIIPGTAGKSLVMRIHSNTIRKINIKSLGINSQELCIIKNNFCKSSGMILFTGPTGSGKTTSLYACLENFCSKQKKIITVEDPVEYTLPWALQIPVDSDNNISMSQALKASLRHDPDVIVIGEIRDSKSAKLAVRFARTGHLVLATMHSLSAESALNRLTDFEINSKTIAEVLTLIINQRLIPKNSIKEEGENFVLRTGIFSIMEITDQNRYNIISDSNTIFEKSSLNILKNKADELIKNKICSSDIIKEIL